MPTYSYSASRGADLDRARELLGATRVAEATDDDPGEALRSDEDIQAILSRDGFTRGVAWIAAGLYAEFAQEPVRTAISGKSIDYSDRLKAWDRLAAPLREQLALAGQHTPPPPTAQIGQLTAGNVAVKGLR